jgi:hypothetical protein
MFGTEALEVEAAVGGGVTMLAAVAEDAVAA